MNAVFDRKKDSDADEGDLYIRCMPGQLNKLCRQTRFSKYEIRKLYQGFKQECPSGLVTEDAFKEIFAHFFPQGDSSLYAHYVFKTFQDAAGSKGRLNFEDFINLLSRLSRGTVSDKLRWIFLLYDINRDGFITKNEMLIIARSVYNMLGDFARPMPDSLSIQDHVDKVFAQIDTNHDGVITLDEFQDWCLTDNRTATNLTIFDTILL